MHWESRRMTRATRYVESTLLRRKKIELRMNIVDAGKDEQQEQFDFYNWKHLQQY